MLRALLARRRELLQDGSKAKDGIIHIRALSRRIISSALAPVVVSYFTVLGVRHLYGWRLLGWALAGFWPPNRLGVVRVGRVIGCMLPTLCLSHRGAPRPNVER
jgi:hypothetical protein